MTETAGTTGPWGGLKIIGAGFGRTGTLSTKVALEELGFGPCYHMAELMKQPGADALWESIIMGGPAPWDTIFAGFQATVDWPACAFYKEQMQAYPDAKVLLTVRDPERWYESVKSTLYLISTHDPGNSAQGRMVSALVWQRTFDGKFEDKDYAISVYNRHNEEVRQYVPPEKLLVYDLKDGWEPLCAFLGVAVPDKPFPHLNDRESFNEMIKRLSQGEQVSILPEKS